MFVGRANPCRLRFSFQARRIFMRAGPFVVLAFFLAQGGCNWFPYAVDNIFQTPAERVAECRFLKRIHSIAQKAWLEIQNGDPQAYSPDYAAGFECGFVEYVDRGGNGEPPAVPPQHYERGVLRSPEGQAKIEDWYNGYRHGAATARESGLREKVIIPIGRPPRTGSDLLDQTSRLSQSPTQDDEAVPLQIMPTPAEPPPK